MGYYSDVYIELTEKAFRFAVDNYRNNPKYSDIAENPFTLADRIYIIPDCNCVGFFFQQIKWYTDYFDEIKFWTETLSKLEELAEEDEEIGYYFIRMGEEWEDIEESYQNSHYHGYPIMEINISPNAKIASFEEIHQKTAKAG